MGGLLRKLFLNIGMFNIILIFLLKMLIVFASVLLVYHFIKFHSNADFLNFLITVLRKNMNLLSAWYRI